MYKLRSILPVLAVMLTVIFSSCQGNNNSNTPTALKAEKIKAGFIYVGPVGDYGWSNAHDVGRKLVDSTYDWLETTYVESVPEGDAIRIIDQLIAEQKCNVIITTSFGYMEDTVKAAAKYPSVLFMHCSGYKQAANLGTYFAELYQMYYLNGLMAGALSKSGKVGYVGAFPISEVIRHIDAYALGVKAANPKATVHVRWINSWYDPTKAREAAESLVAEGIDALAFTEDSPAVIEVAASHTKNGKSVYAFSHYSPMQSFGPEATVSGQLVDWGIMYDKIFNDIKYGTWSNVDLWWKSFEGAAILGGAIGQPINPVFIDKLKSITLKTAEFGEISAFDLIEKRQDGIKAESFEPFTGPITDQAGAVRILEGVKATKSELLSINYFIDNVVGEIPAQ